MPNPFTDVTRAERWETGIPELNMDQLRAPACLGWLKREGKPADRSLGTFALTAMFNDALMSEIVKRNYRVVIRQLVRTWPELLTEVQAELTAVSGSDNRQNGSRRTA